MIYPNFRTSELLGGRFKDGVVGRRDRVNRELTDAPPAGRRVGVLLEVRHPEPRQETQGKEVGTLSNMYPRRTLSSERVCVVSVWLWTSHINDEANARITQPLFYAH